MRARLRPTITDQMPAAAQIETARLRLDPMMPFDLGDLSELLNDPGLHTFIGGTPKTREELADWLAFVAPGGSPSGEQIWCNWVIRRRDDGRPVGTAQATIIGDEASLAWVTGTPWQGQGFAKEAAAAVASWLRAEGIDRLRASIHPDHASSAAVARSLGMLPTEDREDGEVVWRSR